MFVVLDLVVLTYVVSKFISGSLDVDAMSEADMGLILTLDHLMFIGVMTNALFGAIARALRGDTVGPVDRIVLWGVNIGLIGFGIGLITTTQGLKRISAPVMGAALLIAIAMNVTDLVRSRVDSSVEAVRGAVGP